MKKAITILIILLSFIFEIYSQEINFDFFDSGRKNKGIIYSKALLQPKIDSTKNYKRYEDNIFEVIETESIDTLFFINFSVLKNKEDIDKIISYSSIVKDTILITPSKKRIVQEACNGNREWIEEEKIKVSNNQKWIFKDHNRVLESSNWIIETEEEYYKKKKFVVKMPCDPRVEFIPAKYQIIIKVIPKNNLSEEELRIIKKYTVNYIIYSEKYQISYLRKRKEFIVEEYEYYQKTPAQIVEVEVYSKNEIKKKMPSIEENLIKKKYLSQKSQHKVEAIKIGIIRFQNDNNLPIGQYDKKSINQLLK